MGKAQTKLAIHRQLVSLFEQTSENPASVGMSLRVQVASELGKLLKQRGWSQAKLALETDIHPGTISEIMHADANVTLDTIGRLLFSLGVGGRFEAIPAAPVITFEESTDGEESPWRIVSQATESTVRADPGATTALRRSDFFPASVGRFDEGGVSIRLSSRHLDFRNVLSGSQRSKRHGSPLHVSGASAKNA
jgi:transcriptional regulator with XRE-family HTH domain